MCTQEFHNGSSCMCVCTTYQLFGMINHRMFVDVVSEQFCKRLYVYINISYINFVIVF